MNSAKLGESPIAAQLRQGFRWLRFERSLERAFQREQHLQTQVQLRLNLVMAIALVVAFDALDRTVTTAEAGEFAQQVRYFVVVPGLLLCLGLTFLRAGPRLYPLLVRTLAPLAMVCVAAVEINASLHGSALHFSTMVLATIFVYYLAGLTFYGAAIANLVGLLTYVVGGTYAGLPAYLVTYNGMVLFIANVVGAAVAYNLETAWRTGWLEAQLLSEVALRDGLTGIFNRRRLDEHLARTWQQGAREMRSLALLMVDIDYFKNFNDQYGHQAGDESLKAVAGVLASSARRPLDFVARYGGEEFVVVLYDASRGYAEELAKHIQEGVAALAIPNAGSSVSPILTVSIGVAVGVPTLDRSPEGLLQLADEALYSAKHGGRNRVRVMEAEYEHLKTGMFQLKR